jgi:hypothetical protein
LIIVGGPCINKIAAKSLGLEYPSCGASSSIPENKAIVKSQEERGTKLIIAGWEAVHTRNAIKALRDYLNNDNELNSEIIYLEGDILGSYSFV